ncbi:MAG TPA: hypothetical protein VKA55_06540 [Gammaproteobacteria bacterium]|nr:hypothetical protein [Gammaproteobacteria bacterium]
MERQAIAALIPHAGDMVLVERVEEWSAEGIRCRTGCHRWAANPLRRAGRLEAIQALEIGAQAVAVHASLLAAEAGGGEGGVKYLAAVRDLAVTDGALDDIAEDLVINATCLVSQGEHGIYQLEVVAGEREILTGQITVMGQPSEGP